MKKILTLLAAFALTLPAWGEFAVSSFTCYIVEDGVELVAGSPSSGVRYEDGSLLVQNETFRALAVWWDGFSSVSDDYIPFELNVQGEPVPVPGAESAAFVWMETTTFGKIDNGGYPKYAPVREKLGITGVTYSSLPTGVYTFSFSLNKYDVAGASNVEGITDREGIPDNYKETPYRVYFITQDTRLRDGTVSAGEPERLVKWNAIYATACEYNMYYIGKPFALNFTPPNDNFIVTPLPSPTRRPYVEVPETDASADEEVDAALDVLVASLSDTDYATITKINNPAVPNVILDPGIVLTEDGVVTFEYDFGISDISVTQANTVEAKVKLGEEHTFAKGVTVSLIDADGTELELTGTVDSTNPNVYTFTMPLQSEKPTLHLRSRVKK